MRTDLLTNLMHSKDCCWQKTDDEKMHQIELKIEQEKLDYDEFYYVYPTKNVFLSFIYCVISLMYFSYERIFHSR